MSPPGRHGEHLAELVACRREREAAQAQVGRVQVAIAALRLASIGADEDVQTGVRTALAGIEAALKEPPATTNEEG